MARTDLTPDASESALFHGEMGLAPFTRDFYTRQEAEMNDPRLPLYRRLGAYTLRYSWGNSCRYMCFRESATLKPPRSPADAARELKDPKGKPLGRKKVQAYYQREIRAGRMQVLGKAAHGAQMLALVQAPGTVVPPEPPNEAILTYAAYFESWRAANGERADELDKARALVSLIRKEVLTGYREATRSTSQEATRSDVPENGSHTLQPKQPLAPPRPINKERARASISITSLEVVSQSVSSEADRPTDLPAPIPDNRTDEMQALLLGELKDRFPNEVPGRSACIQCIETLGDTDWERFRDALRHHKWKSHDVMGKARAIALDVRDRWLHDAPKRKKLEAAAAAEKSRRDAAAIANAWETYERGDEREKQMAREILESYGVWEGTAMKGGSSDA